MLFMVIEIPKDGDWHPVGERFRREGRLMPDEVEYIESWMDLTGTRCFQIMEAPRVELMHEWTRRWQDLVDFEVIPILTSAEFWEKARSASG